jgi:hypothetical protein
MANETTPAEVGALHLTAPAFAVTPIARRPDGWREALADGEPSAGSPVAQLAHEHVRIRHGAHQVTHCHVRRSSALGPLDVATPPVL